MADPDRPPLSGEVYESIAQGQYEIDKEYSRVLQALRVPLFDVAMMGGPKRPKQPLRLFRTLADYACALFQVEARQYPPGALQVKWLCSLAARIETKVMQEAKVEMFQTLTYHATLDQMREAVSAALKALLLKRLPTKLDAVDTELTLARGREALGRAQSVTAAESLGGLKPSNPQLKATANVDQPRLEKPKRLSSTITSKVAAKKLEAFLEASPIEKTVFAGKVDITPRTLLNFRRTGKIKRETLRKIAKEMGVTAEDLLKPD